MKNANRRDLNPKTPFASYIQHFFNKAIKVNVIILYTFFWDLKEREKEKILPKHLKAVKAESYKLACFMLEWKNGWRTIREFVRHKT